MLPTKLKNHLLGSLALPFQRLQEELGNQRQRLLDVLKRESDVETRQAAQLVAAYERARNDPAAMGALLQEQTALQQQQMAVAVAKSASQQAALEALRQQEITSSKLNKDAILKLEDAKAMAIDQLQQCQDMLDKAMNAYVTEIDRARATRGQAMADSERETMLLG